MSVLIPGQGELVHRACVEEQKAYLRTWFAVVEARAWKWANTFGNARPNRIFLITGQTLTNEWAIAHQQNESTDCEILLEPSSGIPQLFEINGHLGYRYSSASASIGFNEYRPSSTTLTSLHSVYLEIIESFPTSPLGYDPSTYMLIAAAFKYHRTYLFC